MVMSVILCPLGMGGRGIVTSSHKSTLLAPGWFPCPLGLAPAFPREHIPSAHPLGGSHIEGPRSLRPLAAAFGFGVPFYLLCCP